MPQTRRVRTAFTLVEMLVVVGIIAILVTITLGVASAVVEGGRKRTTEGLIRALDQTLDIYIDQRGQIPPAWIEVRIDNSGPQRYDTRLFPLFDGVGRQQGGRPIETFYGTPFYLHQAMQIPEVQSAISSMDSRFVKAIRIGVPTSSGDATGSAVELELTTVLDAWGNPIRMVHPRFDGIIKGDSSFASINLGSGNDGFIFPEEAGVATVNLMLNKLFLRQIRRLAPDRETWRGLTPQQIAQNFSNGVGDSDGGICPTPRPYFYSAGPDGDPSTIDDNVYITRPRFAEPN